MSVALQVWVEAAARCKEHTGSHAPMVIIDLYIASIWIAIDEPYEPTPGQAR